jgi:hypothetical protein
MAKPKLKPKQMFLDLGQRSFGRTKTCADCGTLYVLGDEEDEIIHRKMCVRAKKGLVFSSLRGYTVCESFDGKCVVVEVAAGSAKSETKEVRTALRALRRELGSESDYGSDEGTKYYFYLEGLSIIGMLAVEDVTGADVVRLSLSVRTSDKMASSSSVIKQKSSNASDLIDYSRSLLTPNSRTQSRSSVVLGISMIWVDSNYRRNGVGRRLCDAARMRYVYGNVVPRSQIAFSQPTEAGHMFAMAYASSQQDDEIENAFWSYH